MNGRAPRAFAAGFKAFPDKGLAGDQVFARIGAVADNAQDIQVGTRGTLEAFKPGDHARNGGGGIFFKEDGDQDVVGCRQGVDRSSGEPRWAVDRDDVVVLTEGS